MNDGKPSVINGRGYPGLGIVSCIASRHYDGLLNNIHLQAHGADTPLAYTPGAMVDYFVRFVNDLNPNSDTGVQWPQYDAAARLSLEFSIDVDTPLRIVADDALSEAMGVVSALSLRFPF